MAGQDDGSRRSSSSYSPVNREVRLGAKGGTERGMRGDLHSCRFLERRAIVTGDE